MYCPYCPYKATRVFDLEQHVRMHTTKSPFQCRSCSYSAPSLHLLKIHRKLHPTDVNKTYTCAEKGCLNQGLMNEEEFDRHQFLHKRRQIYRCRECRKKVYTDEEFNRHRETVHNRKLFKCSICNKGFLLNQQLKRHKISGHPELLH